MGVPIVAIIAAAASAASAIDSNSKAKQLNKKIEAERKRILDSDIFDVSKYAIEYADSPISSKNLASITQNIQERVGTGVNIAGRQGIRGANQISSIIDSQRKADRDLAGYVSQKETEAQKALIIEKGMRDKMLYDFETGNLAGDAAREGELRSQSRQNTADIFSNLAAGDWGDLDSDWFSWGGEEKKKSGEYNDGNDDR